MKPRTQTMEGWGWVREMAETMQMSKNEEIREHAHWILFGLDNGVKPWEVSKGEFRESYLAISSLWKHR